MSEEEMTEVPPAQKSAWFSLLSSLSSVSDLSSLTAPAFILSPTSLTEFPAYWAEHPDQIATIVEGADEEERMLRVVQFFVSTFPESYTSRGVKTGSEKKPLNPILGEIFFGHWSKHRQWLVAEQVSHHPPKTAFHIEQGAFTLDGHSGQKTSFNGRNLRVKQNGHSQVTLKLKGGHEEKYLLTLPTVKIEGLWLGSPSTELSGTIHVQSSTGFTASIDLKGKGFFSGKAHTFKAQVFKTAAPEEILYRIDGQWHEKSYYDASSKKYGGELFWDAAVHPGEEIEVKPIDAQGELESRRIWRDVADGIRTGDYDKASKGKSRIENEQRALRKARQEKGEEHPLQFFEYVESHPLYKDLGKELKLSAAEQEGYIWNGKKPE